MGIANSVMSALDRRRSADIGPAGARLLNDAELDGVAGGQCQPLRFVVDHTKHTNVQGYYKWVATGHFEGDVNCIDP